MVKKMDSCGFDFALVAATLRESETDDAIDFGLQFGLRCILERLPLEVTSEKVVACVCCLTSTVVSAVHALSTHMCTYFCAILL